MNSKKHRESEIKALSLSKPAPAPEAEVESGIEAEEPVASTSTSAPVPAPSEADPAPEPPKPGVSLAIAEDATEEEIIQTLDEKIAAARARLSPAHCLFCSTHSASLEDNLTHMSSAHSFFVPDAEYLTDLPGLLAYLGEKVAVGNVCLFCNGRGREFRTLDAVRKHMVDKSHCKIAYEAEADMLEVADFYDFTKSYPDWEERAQKKEERRAARQLVREEKRATRAAKDAAEGWEDAKEEEVTDGAVDEVVDESASEAEESSSDGGEEEEASSDEDEEGLPEAQQITYGDSSYELVLPNGKRLIHRDMQRYFRQRVSLAPHRADATDPSSGAALVRRLLNAKNAALVPRRGGFGAFGAGTDVVRARNAGEAREAGRHVREFRDVKRREQFKTMVGFKGNYQKHFRDPLLQVRLTFFDDALDTCSLLCLAVMT
jgi:pre-60S factor REI1